MMKGNYYAFDDLLTSKMFLFVVVFSRSLGWFGLGLGRIIIPSIISVLLNFT
jgi:hypothetical protein